MSDCIATWDGAGFELRPYQVQDLQRQLKPGDVLGLKISRPRSRAMHRRFFAMVQRYWENLPEDMMRAPFAQSAEHLRYHALIATGFCETITHQARTRAEADRVAATFATIRDCRYALIYRQGLIVYRSVALSQAFNAMSQEDFQAASDRIETYLAGLVGADLAEAA